MDFYKKLTALIKTAREIKELDLSKSKDNADKKEKKFKEFNNKLNSILSFPKLSKDGINFRKYWIQMPYIVKLIESSIKYLPNSENEKIKNLIDKAKKCDVLNDNIINEKKKEVNEIVEEKNEIKINKNINNENSNIKDKNKNNIDIKKINIGKVENFYPKNYKKNNQKETKENNNINVKEEKKEKNDLNLNGNYNIFFDNYNDNDNFMNFYDDNNNDFNINYLPKKNFEENKNEIKYEQKKKDDEIDLNNSNNKSFQIFNDININNKDNIEKLKHDLNNKNNNEKNNNFIYKEKKNEQKNIPKENIINKNEEKKKEPEIIIQNNKQNKPLLPKQENEFKKMEEFCDENLNNSNDNNIIQIIFDSLLNIKKNNNNKTKDINQICSKIFGFVKRANSKKKNLKQNFKEKLITLICILYPFSKGQKAEINKDILIPDSPLDEKLYDFLSKSIIIKPDNDFKFSEFNDNKAIENFCYDLKLNMKLGKYQIYNAFMFLVILRNLRKYDKYGKYKDYFDNLLKKEYMISFKLIFILKHIEFYEFIINDFTDIYNGLFFIKFFYDEIFSEIKCIHKDKDKYIFNNVELSLNKNCDYDIKKLVLDKDEKIYDNVMKKIEYFYHIDKYYYSIDIYNLINYSNYKHENPEYNFIFNLVELETLKIDYIYNNFPQYKKNLLSLEKDIFDLGLQTLNINKNVKILAQYPLNQAKKQVFDSLKINIKRKVGKDYYELFELYPYGSVTEFLGNRESDIDIYLHIKKEDNKSSTKLKILYSIQSAIAALIGKNPEVIISTRLCVIKFKYGSNSTDFDISLMGFCPYLHSILIRTYALIDPRFTLLAIALKKFKEILRINNQEKNPLCLNTFCWMVLLISFLQDIINPQILPKLLSNKNNSIRNIEIQFGNNSKKNNNNRFCKTFENFVKNIRKEMIQIPDFLLKKNNLNNNINFKQGENKLSCAELFLSFLEYIIYYFKYDAVYANCSIENEGYESIKDIFNVQDSKEKNKRDDIFYNYIAFRYFNKKNHDDSKKTKDGMILIRDPFDSHYNPAHTLGKENYNNFVDSLKFGYLSLIKHGKFEELKKDVFLRENRNNNYKIY